MTELIDFKEFKFERVIDESILTKSITFQGKYKGQDAVVRLEKVPFGETSTKLTLTSPDLKLQRSLMNDIYSRYNLNPPVSDMNDIKAIVVVPANEKVINKYSKNVCSLFTETPDIYSTIVEPFLKHMLETDKNYNQWVYNILERKSEQCNVILDDPDDNTGFMLLPSLKSSGDERDLHLLAISRRKDIRSLRDLTDEHLPLLLNIRDKCLECIGKKYGHLNRQLRSYIHYHPTFYHFHVHFELIDAGEYRSSDRDNLLTSVIDNISLMSDYYQKATLTYPLSNSSALSQALIGKSDNN